MAATVATEGYVLFAGGEHVNDAVAEVSVYDIQAQVSSVAVLMTFP
jgi:hypothetical protein